MNDLLDTSHCGSDPKDVELTILMPCLNEQEL